MWSGNHIGHHTVIEDHVMITSHVVISGCCKVEPFCFFGVNATVRDETVIAHDTLVGAGALILKDTKPYELYKAAGTEPAKIRSDQIRSLSTSRRADAVGEIAADYALGEKRLIFQVAGQSEWMSHHACVPVADKIDDSRLRIYFAPRDGQGRSRVTFIEVDADDPSSVLYVTTAPSSISASWAASMTVASCPPALSIGRAQVSSLHRLEPGRDGSVSECHRPGGQR
jgi:hypothetical protein